MEMSVLVEKLWNLEASAIKFIEQYYAQELKDPKLIIELRTDTNSSYYYRENSQIIISSKNLESFRSASSIRNFLNLFPLAISKISALS